MTHVQSITHKQGRECPTTEPQWKPGVTGPGMWFMDDDAEDWDDVNCQLCLNSLRDPSLPRCRMYLMPGMRCDGAHGHDGRCFKVEV